MRQSCTCHSGGLWITFMTVSADRADGCALIVTIFNMCSNLRSGVLSFFAAIRKTAAMAGINPTSLCSAAEHLSHEATAVSGGLYCKTSRGTFLVLVLCMFNYQLTDVDELQMTCFRFILNCA